MKLEIVAIWINLNDIYIWIKTVVIDNCFQLIFKSRQNNKKAFQSNANCPLADWCMGTIVNKFERVWSVHQWTSLKMSWGDNKGRDRDEEVVHIWVIVRAGTGGSH